MAAAAAPLPPVRRRSNGALELVCKREDDFEFNGFCKYQQVGRKRKGVLRDPLYPPALRELWLSFA